jgi:hypothetical protein
MTFFVCGSAFSGRRGNLLQVGAGFILEHVAAQPEGGYRVGRGR